MDEINPNITLMDMLIRSHRRFSDCPTYDTGQQGEEFTVSYEKLIRVNELNHEFH